MSFLIDLIDQQNYRWARAELQKCQIFLLRVRHKECPGHTEFPPLLGY
jgi:hypothetical protein